jgi:outer membrane protein OmpA-like peptidoglycan-associated protein
MEQFCNLFEFSIPVFAVPREETLVMARLRTVPKVVLTILAVVLFVFGLRKAAEYGLIPTPGVMKALVPEKAVLPDLKDALVQNVEPAPLPGSASANVRSTLIRGEIWEWNAQIGMIYANGGASTTKGSLMERHGVNLLLIRQDDTGKMQEDLIACAREISSGSTQCSNGANFVIIMGDGSGQFLAAINPQLKKLGPDYQAKIIGAAGYSRGEDAFMAPAEVKGNPQAAKGLLVEGVLRDGDWNIAQKWEGDNGIKNNPDEKTYDPDAVNWINASDYNVAAADYVAGKCDDRKVVKDGHLTGETKHICVNAVVTWTPGDVTVAKGKGGLVKVVSSKQYRSQMPAVIVGPKNFFERNRPQIEGMLAATFEGGDQVKAFDQSLHKASAISAKLYNDQDEAYWYKYYKGVTETDAQGLKVELGGSAVNNLADNLILYGLEPGTNDNFRSTYTVFGNIATQQYPALFKDTPIPDVKDIEDKSFITGAQARMGSGGAEGETPQYAANETGPVVSKRSYSINFDTGKATFTTEGVRTMQGLKDSLAITGLFIQVDGFTDNTGSEQVNQALSDARAGAVKDWLQKHAPRNFPDSRFRIAGHGSQNPVATNETSVGKAANRRVEITLLGS